jgi:hypothetical protein
MSTNLKIAKEVPASCIEAFSRAADSRRENAIVIVPTLILNKG